MVNARVRVGIAVCCAWIVAAASGPSASAQFGTDHHLIREGNRYTFDRTGGRSGHIACLSELFLSENMSLGLELAHLSIHTTGTHQLVNVPLGIDETTDHGVRV